MARGPAPKTHRRRDRKCPQLRTRRQPGWVLLAAGAVAIATSIAGCPNFDTAADDAAAARKVPSRHLRLSPAAGLVQGGARVTITSVSDAAPTFTSGCAVLFGGFLGTDVERVDDDTLRVTAPAQAAGRVDVSVRHPEGDAVTERQAFKYVTLAEADADVLKQLEALYPGAPRLVSAVATSNTSVRVTFSEPVQADATDPSNYSIVIVGGGILRLDAGHPPVLSPDRTVINIRTLSQAAAEYQITVTGVHDLAGNPIAPPEMLVNPAVTTFNGIPPANIDEHTDSDGDGFADWFELLGWEITIELADGTRIQGYVTSDPYNPDTDGDGLNDALENALSLDPRTDDTDADLVPDPEEFYDWRSDPCDQDTDDDGFSDQTEIEFQTSPILADTDGDQLDDRDEMLNRSRNPRIADLPIPVITVGEINLELDERYTYSDQFGREQQFSESYSNTLQRETGSSYATTDSTTTRWHIEARAGVETGIEAGKGDLGPTFKWYGKIFAEASGGFAKEDTHSTTAQSSLNMARTYNEAISRVSQISSTSSVTRETVGARLSGAVTLAAGSDIAFQVSNLEISVLQQDPQDRSRLVPIATLVPSENDAIYSVGPLIPEIGPLVFQNSEIFPSMVEALMKDSRGLVFEVANFSITDELDRNFAFSSQEVVERTAKITIDFGNGESESYQIATAGRFDRQARPLGISMADALRAIELDPWDGEDPELGSADDPADPRPKATDAIIQSTFGMRERPSTDDDGAPIQVRVITRVRGVQDDFDTVTVEPNKPNDGGYWVTFATLRDPNTSGAGPALRGTANFDEVQIQSGESYILAFVKDKDRDLLTSLEEFFSGSSDSLADTDQDDLGDFLEVQGQWNGDGLGAWYVYTDRLPGGYRTYSAPYMADSDEDGLDDDTEYALCRYRYNADGTVPANAFATETTDNGVATWDVNPEDVPYAFPPAGGLSRTWHRVLNATTGMPVQIPSNRASLDPRKVDTDEDGVSDADEVNGYYVDIFDENLVDGITYRVFVYSDPLSADTDKDGLLDGMELQFGTNPVSTDSGTVFDDDLDGLPNRVEETGWTVTINGVERQVFSNPSDPDSDNDNLPDYIEWVLGTSPWYDCDPADTDCFDDYPDPNLTAPGHDTDGDGLSDYEEWDGVVPPQLLDELAFCDQIPNCAGYIPNDVAFETDPVLADTDGDNLNDGDELAGWMVYLAGGPAGYPVFSDPLVADTDLDGWGDGDEHAYGTDPGDADTDGDGTLDPVEPTRIATDGTARDPLVQDQRVTIAFDWFYVTEDGVPGAGVDCLSGWPGTMRFYFGTWWVNGPEPDEWLTSLVFFDGEYNPSCPDCWDGGECSSGTDCDAYCMRSWGPTGRWVNIRQGSELWLPGYVDLPAKSYIAPYGAVFVPYGHVQCSDDLEINTYSWHAFDSMTPVSVPVANPLQMLNATTGPDQDLQGDPIELSISGRILVD
jgi:hypothetical protein